MREIPLSNGGVALVDDGDYERAARHRWHRHPKGYVQATIGGKPIMLHRFIDETPPGFEVDHANRDKADHRRANLRRCMHAQNIANRGKTRGTSRHKGVHWSSARQKWYAQIQARGKKFFLGRFADETTAARAYDSAAVRLFGEFALLNAKPEPLR
jgi:hypothetical protein